MRLIIIDPNLEGTSGHHAQYDRVIGSEARRRGIDATIIGNRKFPSKYLAEIQVHALLSVNCYQTFSSDSLFGSFEDVELGNRAVADDLRVVPADFLHEGDLVLLPTVTHTTLLGTLAWLAAMPERSRPSVTVLLMFPSGVSLNDNGERFIYDPAAALGYRRAFQLVAEAGLRVHFMATGRQHAKEFSALSGFVIESHALISSFDEAPPVAAKLRQVLLGAGDAKMNKGLGLMPQVIAGLLPRHPDVTFVLHANRAPAWGEAVRVLDKLEDMAGEYPNLTLRTGELSATDYADLLSASEVVFLPYDPEEYAHKSSGVTWEAIAAGAVLVLPRQSWLAREAALWGTAFQDFAPYAAEAAVDAVDAALRDLPELRAKSAKAAARMRATSGVKHLFDQVADQWLLRHIRLGIDPVMPFKILPRHFDGEGWHATESFAGTDIRWTTKRATLRVNLPVNGGWNFQFHGMNKIGEDQITKAVIEVDGNPVTTTCEIRADGWMVQAPFHESEFDGPMREVALVLPWTYAPPADNRELGVLVHSLLVSPDQRATANAKSITEDISPPLEPGVWSDPVQHFSLRLRLDPTLNYEVTFTLPHDTAPSVGRQISAFLGGVQLVPAVTRGDDWAVVLPLSARQLAGSFVHMVDVILPAVTPICFGEVRLVAAKKLVRASKATVMAAPAATPVQPSNNPAAPIAVEAAPPQASAGASYGTAKLAEFRNVGRISILTLELTDAVLGGIKLRPFYLKLLRESTYVALELRERDGAFQLLDSFPMGLTAADDFGNHLTVFVDGNGRMVQSMTGLRALGTAKLEQLLTCLPQAILSATGAGVAQIDDPAIWTEVAERIGTALQAVLQAA